MSTTLTKAKIRNFGYHPSMEQFVDIAVERAQATSRHFFRLQFAYYMAVMASMMRANLKMSDMGDGLINLYGINLAPSGYGKGLSTGMLEKEVCHKFFAKFLDETMDMAAETNMYQLAVARANLRAEDPDDEVTKLQNEYARTGEYEPVFGSATMAAIRESRHKLLMAGAGSLSFQVDEIGMHMSNEGESLSAFLELWDGQLTTALRKNTQENKRFTRMRGVTPCNLMLFGSASKLLNGTKTEEELFALCETGYARRSFFGCTYDHSKNMGITADQLYSKLSSKANSAFLDSFSQHCEGLADLSNLRKDIHIKKDVALLFLDYHLYCNEIATSLPEHEDIRRIEAQHRQSKARKLAGALAFMDGADEVTKEVAEYAIRFTEDSGDQFNTILNRERPHVKLAKYIAGVKREITQADLIEDLPFYKGGSNQKQDMMNLAIAWGYQNNIVIRRAFNDGIEFLRGETLEETDLDKMIISYSEDFASDYGADYAPFDDLHLLTQNETFNWCSHHFLDNHRNDANVIPGFNMIVLDVDGTCPLSTAQMLLKDYKAMFYTTKSHTAVNNRYRIILPTNFALKLDSKDFKEFMKNVLEFLPFESDDVTGQASRKWASHNGTYEYQDGELFDVLPFIPKTTKNDTRRKAYLDQNNFTALERWVLNNTGEGNRNKQLLKYALILTDAGMDFGTVQQRVFEMNEKLVEPLDSDEIVKTIMTTVSKKAVA